MYLQTEVQPYFLLICVLLLETLKQLSQLMLIINKSDTLFNFPGFAAHVRAGKQSNTAYMYIFSMKLDNTCEPPRGKTNNVVSKQVRHKPICTSTEKS